MIKQITFLALCIACAAHAQRPLRWEASAVQTAQVTFDCTRGETLTFAPYIKAYGTTLTNYTASFVWQTNGMGSLCWSTNVLAFTPSMDYGANKYRFFIRAESSNGVMYSAQGTINMLHGPGAIINALPLPVQSIDFAAVSWLNAPWLLSADLYPVESRIESVEGGTNAWNAAAAWGDHAAAGYYKPSQGSFEIAEPAGGITFQSWPAGGENSVYFNYIGFRNGLDYFIDLPPFSNISQTIATREWTKGFSETNPVYRIYAPGTLGQWLDGEGNKYVVSNFWEMSFSSDFGQVVATSPAQTNYVFTSSEQQYLEGVEQFGTRWTIGLSGIYHFPGGFYTRDWLPTTNSLVLDPVIYTGATGHAFIRNYATTNLIGALATTADINQAIASMPPSGLDGAAVTNIVASLREFHVDSYTNIIWRSVYSNGWMWLVAYTNYPAQ